MCLILFAYKKHPDYPLILAANRDEFLSRPTAAAARWEVHPDLVAGKDLVAGGTWMGITDSLRFSAITNYRDPALEKKEAPSRGHLVLDYLTGQVSPAEYLQKLQPKAAAYNGFNLLAGGHESLWYFSNRENAVREVEPGIYGLSNHLLDTPWPKVEKGKRYLAQAIEENALSVQHLTKILADNTQAPDHQLPKTGVPLEWERLLSSMFIDAPNYGTRASSVLLIDKSGKVTFYERTIDRSTGIHADVLHELNADRTNIVTP